MKNSTEFENIYQTFYRDVFAFLYRTCGQNYHLAEELTQETFYEAFRCFHRYNATCSILTWLCAIGKNIWFHYLRKNKNAVVNIDTLEETLCDDGHTPDDMIEQSERDEMIRKVLDTLPERYKEIIWLRNMAELPFQKIADILGITENSAKVLYFRAKNQMKERLQDEGLF